MTDKEWRRVRLVNEVSLPRPGWRGIWDRIAARATGRPVRLEPARVCFSAYVLAPPGASFSVSIHGARLEMSAGDGESSDMAEAVG